MKAHFEMFAAYNAWANDRLYAAAGNLPGADYRRDCGAAFGSIGATLNHIMVADLIWLARFRGQACPLALDHILHEDHAELTAARRVLDDDVARFVAEQTDEILAASFEYRNMQGEPFRQPLDPALAHLFNHQTHHRGQCHAMLTRLAGEAPALDLIYFQHMA